MPVALLAVTACSDDQPPDGVFDTGDDTADATGVGTDVALPDMADDGDTGDGPQPADACLFEAVDDRYAYEYQCDGDIAIDVLMEGDVVNHRFVDDVEISVRAATWTGLDPEGSPVVCWSIDENDGVVFVQTDPVPESKLFHLAAGDGVALHGPALIDEPIEGFAELSAVSSLALRTGPAIRAASLESLELLAAEAGHVRATGKETVAVDELRIRLWDRALATLDDARETLTIAPGRARFAVSTTIFGAASVVAATNETAIVLTRNGAGWSSAAFAIAYEEWGDQWSLVILPTHWQ